MLKNGKKRVFTFLLIALLLTGGMFLHFVSERKEGGCNVLLAGTKEEDQEADRFRVLQNLHLQWRDGVFGDRPYYRRELYRYLLGLLGKRIRTDYQYYLISPECVYEKRVKSAFSNDQWLVIKGEVETESIRKIIGKDVNLLKQWYRSRLFLAVSGRIRDYRLDDWDKRIVLSLDRMRVEVKKKRDDNTKSGE